MTDGRTLIAFGSDPKQMYIYDYASGDLYFQVTNWTNIDTSIYWEELLTFIDDNSGHQILVLSGHDGCAAIDVDDKRVMWEHSYDKLKYTSHWDAVCFDIDGDGDIEFLEIGSSDIPGIYHMHVRDAMTGEEEYIVNPLPERVLGMIVCDLNSIIVYDDGSQILASITVDGEEVTANSNITFHSMFKEYLIQVTVLKQDTYTTLNSIKLTFDPGGTGYNFFYEPGYHRWLATGSIVQTEASITETDEEILVSFHFYVDWSFPHEDRFMITVSCIFDNTTTIGVNLPNVFRVENDIQFSGTLNLIHSGQSIDSTTWLNIVSPLEGSGLTVTYQGAPEKLVAPYHYKTMVLIAGASHNTTNNGGLINFSIDLKTLITGEHNGRIVFNLWPSGSDVENVSFNIRLDAEAPDILKTIPEYDGWYSSNSLVLGLIATDLNGSGIDITSIELRIAPRDKFGPETIWSHYEPIKLIKGSIIQFLIEMQFENGIYNYQWRLTDIAGNDLSLSQVLELKVDIIKIQFSEQYPSDWQNSTEVVTGIRIAFGSSYTLTYSRVQYGYWNDLEKSPSWFDIDLTLLSGTEVYPSISGPMNEGLENYIQWRVFVNETISIRISVNDSLSGLDRNKVFFRIDSASESTSGSWKSATVEMNEIRPTAVIEIDGSMGGEFYLWMRVFDNAGNVNSSISPYSFIFNRPPRIVMIEPSNGTTFNESDPIELRIEFEDPDGDEDINVRWRHTNGSWNVAGSSTELLDLPVGNHTFIVSVDDGHGNFIEQEISIEVVAREELPGPDDVPLPDPSDDPDTRVGFFGRLPIIILVIIIVVILVSIAIARERSGTKM
ncbi:MAG: hypothetical protein ACXADF_19395, partial [Candidatus Thorarchaeota archaeon]|jgi:hypothetical protein